MGGRMLAIAAILLGLLPCAAAAQDGTTSRGSCPCPQQVISELAPTGVLRAGINMSNFLLVREQVMRTAVPIGVAPDMAGRDRQAAGRALSSSVPFKAPGASWPRRRRRAPGTSPSAPSRSGREDRLQPGLLRDRGDLSGAGGLSHQVVAEVDRAGVRISVGAQPTGSSSTRTVKKAQSVRTEPRQFVRIVRGAEARCPCGPPALAPHRGPEMPGARVLDGQFTEGAAGGRHLPQAKRGRRRFLRRNSSSRPSPRGWSRA